MNLINPKFFCAQVGDIKNSHHRIAPLYFRAIYSIQAHGCNAFGIIGAYLRLQLFSGKNQNQKNNVSVNFFHFRLIVSDSMPNSLVVKISTVQIQKAPCIRKPFVLWGMLNYPLIIIGDFGLSGSLITRPEMVSVTSPPLL